MKKIGFLFVSVISFLLFFGCVFAHQPRLVYLGIQQPVIVSNPEISQAFYGNLSGKSDIYSINIETGFHLYVQLVVPMITGARKDFHITIADTGGLIAQLDGNEYNWTGFYEKFAGDWYWQGPEFEKDVGPGLYNIQVDSLGFTGKYSLAIGKIESFPLNEIISTYRDLPSLKTDFFQKPLRTIFYNIVGGGLLVLIVVLGGVIYLIIRFFRK